MSVEMSARSVSLRLHRVAEVTDLHSTRRLDTKLDMRPAAVSRRLATTARLTSLCVRLGRHACPGEPAFRERLGALREACARLATLHGKANAVRRGIREQGGPPGGFQARALQKFRDEKESVAGAIVAELRSSARVLRHLELHYAHVLGRQEATGGFAWTPEVSEAAQDMVGRRDRPTVLFGLRGFPLGPLVRLAMIQELRAEADPWGAAARLTQDLAPPRVREADAASLFPDWRVDEPSPSGGKQAEGLIVSGFFAIDWGSQRALRDYARRHSIWLVVIEPCAPARPEGASFGGYAVPDMEEGVADWLDKQAAPTPRPTDEQAIRRWLLDSRLWAEGLLPLAQLGAGWTGASLLDAS